jgi:hypothetical protein
MKSLALILLLALMAGCGSGADEHEFADKTEYSVLQSLEFESRTMPRKQRFFVRKAVLKTNLDAVAFPMKNKEQGYVWILARTKRGDVKYSTPEDFEVTSDDVRLVEQQIRLSPAAKAYIEARVTEPKARAR